MKATITLEIYYDDKTVPSPATWDWNEISYYEGPIIKVVDCQLVPGEVCWFCQDPIKGRVVMRNIGLPEGEVAFHPNCAPKEN